MFCCREKYLLKQPAHNSDVWKVSSDVTENVLRCHSCLVSPLTRPHPLPLLVHRPSKSKQTKDRLQTSVCVTRRKEMQKAEDPQKHALKKMLENRPENALVKLVKTVETEETEETLETLETVETVETAETVEMVETVQLYRLKI